MPHEAKMHDVLFACLFSARKMKVHSRHVVNRDYFDCGMRDASAFSEFKTDLLKNFSLATLAMAA